jgi:lipopolysaccharide/colanic/teichoic acid biosynthesis glycosyltransferase
MGLESVMTEAAGLSPVQSVPFLVPPAGRPNPATASGIINVRDRLSTKRTQDALDKIAGAMPWHKRCVDILGAACALVLLTPVLVTVALLIKFTDWGPILFWQRRVGLHGREFWFPKFRSMMPNADRLIRMLTTRNEHAKTKEAGKGAKKKDVTFKMKDDPRITWIGKIIRKLSIDEMPQLWCVLKGDMSLVGPRPPLPTEVARYTPYDRRRLEITPGLTCIWQVSGRGDIPFPQQVAMDIEYIEKQGLWFDLKLMAMTIPAVLKGKGAY